MQLHPSKLPVTCLFLPLSEPENLQNRARAFLWLASSAVTVDALLLELTFFLVLLDLATNLYPHVLYGPFGYGNYHDTLPVSSTK